MNDAFSFGAQGMSKMIALSNTNGEILQGIVNETIGDGAPKGAFDTLQELNDAYPTGAVGIYLVTANGHWYYWDSEWKDGGIYQATEVPDGTITDEKLNVELKSKVDQIPTMQDEIDTQTMKLTSHEASHNAHDSDSITYIGNVAGAVNTKQAIDSVQTQLNAAVFNGDSSVAAAQAAIDANGHDYENLKLRLDTEQTSVMSRLADNMNYITQNLAKYLANPRVDVLGFKSVNLVGDSISHGANTPQIYNDAWTSVYRKALQSNFENDNHGFVNLFSPLSNVVGQYTDQLYVTKTWTAAETNECLGFYKLTSSVADQYIRAWVQDTSYKVNKVGIAVVKSPLAGNIEITVKDEVNARINTQTYNLNASTTSQDIIWLDVSTFPRFSMLEVVNKTGTNTVTGAYLIDDIDKVVFNNYSRSGARIVDLTDDSISKIFSSSVVIFALGHNDNPNTIDVNLAKCVAAYQINKPMVYVVDLTWTTARQVTAQKLKKFAEDCNGLYIEIIPRVASANELISSGFLSDVSHPTPAGHKIIAEKFLSAVQFPLISKEVILNNRKIPQITPSMKTITMGSGFTLNAGVWTKTGKTNNITIDITGSLTEGSIVCTFDVPVKSINLMGFIWGTAGGNVPCVCFLSGSNGSLQIYPGSGITGNRFTLTLNYESK